MNWVIVALNEAIAQEYAAEKKPDRQWKEGGEGHLPEAIRLIATEENC